MCSVVSKYFYIANAYIGIMSFIRYKTFGKKEYAYEIKTYWDKKKQKPYQKTKYLGIVIDKKKKLFERKIRKRPESLILDFGDTYVLDKFIDDSKIRSLISKVFSDQEETLLALLTYRIGHGSAMRYAQSWMSGNYARIVYKNASLSSQRISDFLGYIGDERLQREFFSNYIRSFCKKKQGIIIDGTSLPNQIHMPLSAWGLSGEEIDKQIRFLLVVDKESSIPIFFRALPGNILDVSTISNTLDELKRYGVSESFVYLDAGFFSEENINELYMQKVQFLTRLPSLRILYKQLIAEEIHDIESVAHAVRYGKRGLFIKQKTVDLFGHKAYAHIVLDPERKGRETKKFLLDIIDEKGQHDEQELSYALKTRGIMILVSSFQIDKKDVVPTYYVRQTAEMLFGFSKDDLNILPLRVHNESTLRGFLFLQFIALATFVLLKKKLGQNHTVEEAMLTLRNLKCKIYDNELVPQEMTKQQKQIADIFNILMPKTLGI
ncbi:transposase [Candidatus Woesearchaeota archaeon]|nr:transposase [Candidatus Woesearchaeota archaeon]